MGGDGASTGGRPDWVWDARIFYFSSIQPRTFQEADQYLDWLEKYGYNVVLVVPDLGEPIPVSAEDPRLYQRPVWEWNWQKDPQQNRVLRYFTQQGHKRGIRFMVQQMVWSINANDYHYKGIPIKPEWLAMAQLNREGKPTFEFPYRVPSDQRNPDQVAHIWVCPLHPTVLQALRDVVPEMMGALGVDVFTGDWNFNGFGCAAPEYLAAYQEDTGQPNLPLGEAGSPDYETWLDWVRGRLLIRATAGFKEALLTKAPDKIIFAYLSNPTRGEYETFPAFAGLLGDEVSIRSSFYDWPWQMAMLKYNLAVSQRYNVPVTELYYTDTRSENLFTWALTHTVGLKMWRLLPWFSQWEAKHASLLNHPQPVGADVALIYSRQTFTRYSDWSGAYPGSPQEAHHPYSDARNAPQEYGGYGWAGWARVLQDLHYPYDVILDGDVTPQRLASYRMVILDNAAALSAAQVEALREFVRQGGTLASTYQASLFDERGEQRADFALSDVLGVHYLSLVIPHSLPFSWQSEAPSYIENLIRKEGPEPVETQWVVEVGAASSAHVLASYGREDRVLPAVVENDFGEGRSLYFAGYPGSRAFFRRYPEQRPDHTQEFVYSDYTDPFYRALLGATIAQAVPRPYIKTSLPSEIIVNPLLCGEGGRPKLCIHLLNALGSRPANGTTVASVPGVDPHLDVGFPYEDRVALSGAYGAGFEVSFPKIEGPIQVMVREPGIRSGYAISPDFEGSMPISIRHEDGYVVVEVPGLERYTIVVLEGDIGTDGP